MHFSNLQLIFLYVILASANNVCIFVITEKERGSKMGFTIAAESPLEITQVPNWFIRTYMPSANGNFVKIYLYLLMLCQHPVHIAEQSLSYLADCMDCTESDILRALPVRHRRHFRRAGRSVGRLLRRGTPAGPPLPGRRRHRRQRRAGGAFSRHGRQARSRHCHGRSDGFRRLARSEHFMSEMLHFSPAGRD